MATVSVHARGDATPETAWARYADLDLWSSWSPQIRRVEVPDGGRTLRAGLRGRVVSWAGPGVAFEVVSVDADARTWEWSVRLGPASVRMLHDVGASGEGSSAGLRMSGPHLLLWGYAPLARLALGRLVRA